MKSYGIDMMGRFVLERVASKPTFTASRDKGRLIYDSSENQAYWGSNTQWVSLSPDYATLNDLQAQITSNDNDISNLQTDLSNLEPRVSDNESDISTLQADLNDHIDSRDEHPLATESLPGFMSASDKTTVNNVPNPGYAIYSEYSNQNHGYLDFPATPEDSYNVNGRIAKGSSAHEFVLQPGYYRIGYRVYFHKTSGDPDVGARVYDITNSQYLDYTRTVYEYGNDYYSADDEKTPTFSFPFYTSIERTIAIRTYESGGDAVIREVTITIEAII